MSYTVSQYRTAAHNSYRCWRNLQFHLMIAAQEAVGRPERPDLLEAMTTARLNAVAAMRRYRGMVEKDSTLRAIDQED